MMNLKKTFLALPFLCTVLACAVPAMAQSYPAGPITIVVPYPPGGSADILARSIGEQLRVHLGQTVVIDNKSGAGTAIGARFVAAAKPDGYTLLMGTVSSQAINPAMNKVGYDPLKDFTAVSAITSIPFVLVANPAASFDSVAELIGRAKQAPNSLSYASAGPGTSNHLAGVMMAQATKTELVHVPYRGSAPALADVLANHVPIMFDLQTTALPNIQAKRVKPLAVTGLQRSPLLPDVPTLSESGLPGFEVSAWFGLFAPAKTPEAVSIKISEAMSKILKTPEVAKNMREMGAEPDLRSASEFATYTRAETVKYGKIIQAAGLVP